MRRTALLLLLFGIESLVFGSFAACSSSSAPTPPPATDSGHEKDGGAKETGAHDARPDVVVDPKNCVPPGTDPNSEGVGGYCSPGGGQCDMVGPGGTAGICTADLGGAVKHAWFCTTPCTEGTTNCGAAAECVSTMTGPLCVPMKCLALVEVEAGADAGGESGGGETGSADGAGDGGGPG